jgi:hypothetical protein
VAARFRIAGKKKGRPATERPKSREETPKEGTTRAKTRLGPACRNAQIIGALQQGQLRLLQG